MEVLEDVNLLKDYEAIRKRVAELKQGTFTVSVPMSDDIVVDNKIRDEVMNLMALAHKHHINARLFKNQLNNTYAIRFTSRRY